MQEDDTKEEFAWLWGRGMGLDGQKLHPRKENAGSRTAEADGLGAQWGTLSWLCSWDMFSRQLPTGVGH